MTKVMTKRGNIIRIILVMVLALGMVLGLTGCGSTGISDDVVKNYLISKIDGIDDGHMTKYIQNIKVLEHKTDSRNGEDIVYVTYDVFWKVDEGARLSGDITCSYVLGLKCYEYDQGWEISDIIEGRDLNDIMDKYNLDSMKYDRYWPMNSYMG